MTREQFEFLISQYADGTLPAEDVAVLEERLERDEEARQMLAEHRSVSEMMRTQMPGVPEINWEGFAREISAAVAEADVPARAFRIGWQVSAFAVAASVLIAVGIGIFAFNHGSQPAAVKPVAIAQVEGPTAEAATQPAVAQISIGPANEIAQSEYPLSESIVFGPSSVRLIASNQRNAQDTQVSPYQH